MSTKMNSPFIKEEFKKIPVSSPFAFEYMSYSNSQEDRNEHSLDFYKILQPIQIWHLENLKEQTLQFPSISIQPESHCKSKRDMLLRNDYHCVNVTSVLIDHNKENTCFRDHSYAKNFGKHVFLSSQVKYDNVYHDHWFISNPCNFWRHYANEVYNYTFLEGQLTLANIRTKQENAFHKSILISKNIHDKDISKKENTQIHTPGNVRPDPSSHTFENVCKINNGHYNRYLSCNMQHTGKYKRKLQINMSEIRPKKAKSHLSIYSCRNFDSYSKINKGLKCSRAYFRTLGNQPNNIASTIKNIHPEEKALLYSVDTVKSQNMFIANNQNGKASNFVDKATCSMDFLSTNGTLLQFLFSDISHYSCPLDYTDFWSDKQCRCSHFNIVVEICHLADFLKKSYIVTFNTIHYSTNDHVICTIENVNRENNLDQLEGNNSSHQCKSNYFASRAEKSNRVQMNEPTWLKADMETFFCISVSDESLLSEEKYFLEWINYSSFYKELQFASKIVFTQGETSLQGNTQSDYFTQIKAKHLLTSETIEKCLNYLFKNAKLFMEMVSLPCIQTEKTLTGNIHLKRQIKVHALIANDFMHNIFGVSKGHLNSTQVESKQTAKKIHLVSKVIPLHNQDLEPAEILTSKKITKSPLILKRGTFGSNNGLETSEMPFIHGQGPKSLNCASTFNVFNASFANIPCNVPFKEGDNISNLNCILYSTIFSQHASINVKRNVKSGTQQNTAEGQLVSKYVDFNKEFLHGNTSGKSRDTVANILMNPPISKINCKLSVIGNTEQNVRINNSISDMDGKQRVEIVETFNCMKSYALEKKKLLETDLKDTQDSLQHSKKLVNKIGPKDSALVLSLSKKHEVKFEMKKEFDLVMEELSLFHKISEKQEYFSDATGGEILKDVDCSPSPLPSTPKILKRYHTGNSLTKNSNRQILTMKMETSRDGKKLPQLHEQKESEHCSVTVAQDEMPTYIKERTFSHGIRRVTPLKTCYGPLRIGLSKKAKIKQLHPYLR